MSGAGGAGTGGEEPPPDRNEQPESGPADGAEVEDGLLIVDWEPGTRGLPGPPFSRPDWDEPDWDQPAESPPPGPAFSWANRADDSPGVGIAPPGPGFFVTDEAAVTPASQWGPAQPAAPPPPGPALAGRFGAFPDAEEARGPDEDLRESWLRKLWRRLRPPRPPGPA
jgi:hypothetical protein